MSVDLDAAVGSVGRKRIIVCLCGSTRFKEEFVQANYRETLAGKIVLTIGCDAHSDDELQITPAQKESLDLLHFDKIELAAEILVLNVDGYIGDSTRREIRHAQALHKRVRYLEPEFRRVEDALAAGKYGDTAGVGSG